MSNQATTTSFEILVGRDHEKEFVDNTYWNYTNFQVEQILEIQDRDLFDGFVTTGHQVSSLSGKLRKVGPVSILWYEDNVLNGISLGPDKINCTTMRAVK